MYSLPLRVVPILSGTTQKDWKEIITFHIGANLIPDSVFKPMSKNQNDDNDYLRLFSIVFFAVESDSGVKWSLKLVQGPKKEDLEA